jgi:lysyl-tRNA synthetase class 2
MPRASTDIPVHSSLIRSVTYAADATLTVRFHSGAVYRYFTVPRSTLDAFLAATSKGTHFNRYIRDGFPYQRTADS